MFIHVNLLSNQLIPNVLPVLAQKNNISKIYLVQAGVFYEKKAQQLVCYYQSKGIDDVEIVKVSEPNDYYELRHKASDLYKDICAYYPDSKIILNATCGTKPMSLAFCQEFDKPPVSLAVYTDSFKKRIIVLNDSERLQDLPYPEVLTIDDYLQLNGFVVDAMIDKRCPEVYEIEDRSELTRQIMDIARKGSSVIRALNGAAQCSKFSKEDSFVPVVELKSPPYGGLKQLLVLAQQDGLLEFRDKQITFSDIDCARYLGGGWFEELCYLAAKDAGIEQIALQVVGHQLTYHAEKEVDVTNELDIVLMHNNQMLIVEAKTVDWKLAETSGQNVV